MLDQKEGNRWENKLKVALGSRFNLFCWFKSAKNYPIVHLRGHSSKHSNFLINYFVNFKGNVKFACVLNSIQ